MGSLSIGATVTDTPGEPSRRRRPGRTPAPGFRIKRAYEPPLPADGKRFLVDRLWPRGVRKDAARLDGWLRELAPSDGLCRWYGHDPTRFATFRARYRMEALRNREALASLVVEAERGPVTLVFASRDAERSNATVLKELLEEIH